MLVLTHKLYDLLGIPTDQVTVDPIDDPVHGQGPVVDEANAW